MATVKIKFRSSSVDGREGTVYYQVIHKRVARQINTPYKLFPAEWSKQHSRIIITPSDEGRRQYLLSLDKKISEDTDRLENVITALGRKGGAFTADDVTSAFHGNHCVFSFLFSCGRLSTVWNVWGRYGSSRPTAPHSTASCGS